MYIIINNEIAIKTEKKKKYKPIKEREKNENSNWN